MMRWIVDHPAYSSSVGLAMLVYGFVCFQKGQLQPLIGHELVLRLVEQLDPSGRPTHAWTTDQVWDAQAGCLKFTVGDAQYVIAPPYRITRIAEEPR